MAGALTENNAPIVSQPPPLLKRWDRNVKLTLFLSSLVTFLLLLGAMVRENFMSPWRHFQGEYKQLLLASTDERLKKLADKYDIEIRQVDLPQLGTVDRCVSCHNGLENPAFTDAKQPHRMHSGQYLKWHPVSKYGCTICHRGQGAATDFFEAKAVDVHWEYPLLPLTLTQSSCGACHAPDSKEMQTHAPMLADGRQLFIDRGCQSCHKLGGVGGQLGPALDGIGMKIKHQLPMTHLVGEHTLPNWLAQHFENPQKIVANSQMRPPKLTASENVALTIYMLSLSNRDLPQTYVPKDRIAAQNRDHFHKELNGEVLFRNYCANCHGNGSFAEWDKFFVRFMPAVRGPGLRGLADHEYFKTAITQGRPGTLMPAWGKNAGGLTDEQVEKLVNYLMAGDQRTWTPPASPIGSLTGGNVQRGNELFQQMCAGCHGANKLAPTLSNTVLQKSASDDFLARTILFGRPDTPMPAFRREGAQGLSDEEVRDLIAYVRSLGNKGTKP